MATTPEIDVLIVGAGPTGVTMALELAAHRISFRLIEKVKRRSDKSRALGIQPRTLELLNRHGNIQNLISRGNLSSGTTFFVDGKRAIDINVSGLAQDTAFPLILIVDQCHTEEFLDECLAQHGYPVELGVEATSLVQDADGVTTTTRNLDGVEETIRSKYVVGADGAHSKVRRAAAGLTFEGGAYEQDFILCDASIRDSKISWNRFSLCMGKGSLAVFPLKDGTVRIVASRMGRRVDAEPTLEDFQALFNYLHPYASELYNPTWMTQFHLHHRGVNSYRDRRLFVAGDAAHIHSPAGAQGMNTGIQDSINLGWKLAKVIQGQRSESLLDSYDDERRPIGQHLLKTSDKMFTWACSSNIFFVIFRNLLFMWILPWVVTIRSRRAKVYKFISQLGISYRGSPIVGTARGFSGPVKGGDRAPNAMLRSNGVENYFHELITPDTHHLVVMSGVGPHRAQIETMLQAQLVLKDHSSDKAKLHVILSESDGSKDVSVHIDIGDSLHRLFGVSKPFYVYIRPDGYTEYIGFLSQLRELSAWLA